MSKISDLYRKKKLQEQLIAKTKLEEIIKASEEKRKLEYKEEKECMFSYDEIRALETLLHKNGLDNGSDYYFKRRQLKDVTLQDIMLVIKENNKLVSIFKHGENLAATNITNFKDIENILKSSFYYDMESKLESELDKVKKLSNIDLEQIKIEPSSYLKEIISNELYDESIDFEHLAYDLETHEVIETEEDEIEDNTCIVYLEEAISNTLRKLTIDTIASDFYGDSNVYYTKMGEHSDLPGEEEIHLILNSIDRKILKQYFKKYPDELILFEKLKKEDDTIKGLEDEPTKNKAEEVYKNIDDDFSDLSIEELEQMESNLDKNIADNEEQIRQAKEQQKRQEIINRILAKQKEVAKQKEEMSKLKGQKKIGLDE